MKDFIKKHHSYDLQKIELLCFVRQMDLTTSNKSKSDSMK